MEKLFDILSQNFVLVLFVGWAVLSWIGALAKQASKARQRRAQELSGPGELAPRRVERPPVEEAKGESDLEQRVRRNLEELMQRKLQVPPLQAPVLEKPPPIVRAPVEWNPVAARALESATTEKVVLEPRKATPGKVGITASAPTPALTLLSMRTERAARLRGEALDLETLRRAVLLREVLDAPVALRQSPQLWGS